jgi:hypothetical protein
MSPRGEFRVEREYVESYLSVLFCVVRIRRIWRSVKPLAPIDGIVLLYVPAYRSCVRAVEHPLVLEYL